MVFNATFNKISVISWWSVLLVEETGVPAENHQLPYDNNHDDPILYIRGSCCLLVHFYKTFVYLKHFEPKRVYVFMNLLSVLSSRHHSNFSTVDELHFMNSLFIFLHVWQCDASLKEVVYM